LPARRNNRKVIKRLETFNLSSLCFPRINVHPDHAILANGTAVSISAVRFSERWTGPQDRSAEPHERRGNSCIGADLSRFCLGKLANEAVLPIEECPDRSQSLGRF